MYGNHFYNQPQRFQMVEPVVQQYPNQQFNNQQYQPTIQQPNNQYGLLGKSVDSVDVVKAMDIPLDGSTSYFPLTDGSAIVTKRLLNDGTSKTIVYKPVKEQKEEKVKYATLTDIENAIQDIDFSEINDLKDEIQELKKQIKELQNPKKSK